MNLITIIPPIKPPKCKDCKWSSKFNENTLLCNRFKNKSKQLFNLKYNTDLFELNYYIDVEMARGNVHLCGTYGIYFEPK